MMIDFLRLGFFSLNINMSKILFNVVKYSKDKDLEIDIPLSLSLRVNRFSIKLSAIWTNYISYKGWPVSYFTLMHTEISLSLSPREK